MSLDHLDTDDWEPAEGEHPTWSMEEIDNHPLFMTDLSGVKGSNEAVEALQAALYDDETPESLCLNFKNHGNDALKRGSLDDAIIFYQNAVSTKCTDKPLMAQVHSNMALAYLKKTHYPQCVDECYRAIGCDVNNSKAYYRGALASLKLELFSQGLYFAKGGVSVDPDNKDIQELLVQLEDARRKQDEAKARIAAAADPVKPKPKYRWRD